MPSSEIKARRSKVSKPSRTGRRAQAKFRYVVQPLEVSESGAEVKVRSLLTGTFPGSPVELTYHFVLAGDTISSLEIH
jgi:hypothetical protein